MIHAFTPPDMHKKASQYYTECVQLKHALQRRQLQAFHTDAHWFSTLCRYWRELAIQNHEGCVFISCDKKVKIDSGEIPQVYAGKEASSSPLPCLVHSIMMSVKRASLKQFFFFKMSMMCLSKLVKVGSFISYTVLTSALHLFCFS